MVATVKGRARLADVGHLSWSVSVLHVLEERGLVSKRQLTDFTPAWREKWIQQTSTTAGGDKRKQL